MPSKTLWTKIQPKESSISLSISEVVAILEDFCLLLGNRTVWGQFSQAHYYRLGLPWQPNFIEISPTVSPPGAVKDFVDKHTYIDQDRVTDNKGCLAVPANTHMHTAKVPNIIQEADCLKWQCACNFNSSVTLIQGFFASSSFIHSLKMCKYT